MAKTYSEPARTVSSNIGLVGLDVEYETALPGRRREDVEAFVEDEVGETIDNDDEVEAFDELRRRLPPLVTVND
jgi:hypothetical protein